MIRFINEMSYQRKVAIDRIRDIAVGSQDKALRKHVMLCILYPNSNAITHWSKEITNFLIRSIEIGTSLKGNKKLSYKDFYNLLFLEPFELSDKAESIRIKIHITIQSKDMNIKPKYTINSSKEDFIAIYNKIDSFYKKVISDALKDITIINNEYIKKEISK